MTQKQTNAPRASSVFLWFLATLGLAALGLAMLWSAFDAISAGELTISRSRRNPVARIVTYRDSPLEFALQVTYRMVIFAILAIVSYLRIDTWRTRRDTGRAAWDKEMANVVSASSKAGNVIAWILVVPFVVVLLITAAGMILRLVD